MIPTVTSSGVVAPSTAASSGVGTGSAYVVQPGDTLTAIATRAGTTVAQLAADNGLNPNGLLIASLVIHLPDGGGVSGPGGSCRPRVGLRTPSPKARAGPPYPTPQPSAPPRWLRLPTPTIYAMVSPKADDRSPSPSTSRLFAGAVVNAGAR